MKIFKRSLALLLVAVMCLAALAGCGKDGEDAETTAADTARTYTDAELRAMEKDNLPDWVSTKFQGRTVTTYSFLENFERDTNGYGEITGDSVHDLVYKRNVGVQQRLGITFDNRVSNVAKFSDYASELNVMANSMSEEYDFIYTMGNSAILSGAEHIYFEDVSQYEYLSLDSKWWNKEAMTAVSFDGKRLPYLVGDLTITTYTKAGAIFVNSTEYNNRYDEGLDGLYDTVIAGKWTIELLSQKAKENYLDVYDDGLDDNRDDFIGFGIGSPVRVKALEYGFDVQRWSRDDEGYIQVDFDIDRASDAVDKLIELLFDNPGVYYESGDYLHPQSFDNGNMLFYENQLGNITSAYFREMEEDFGILPTPKLDENQVDYMTEIQESSTFVVIPVTCKDTEFASIVIEALCTESYRTVIYPFLEDCLKIQYVRESRAGQNIDIILASARKDYFGLHNPGGIGKLITSTALMESNRISSNYKTLSAKAIAELSKLKTDYFS